MFLLDDVLGDKAMKGYFSFLSYYCLKSRHANVSFIFTAQVFTKLDSSIRGNLSLFVLFYQHPVKKALWEEIPDDESKETFKKYYYDLIKNGEQYSFLMVNNYAGAEHQNEFLYVNGKTHEQKWISLKKDNVEDDD